MTSVEGGTCHSPDLSYRPAQRYSSEQDFSQQPVSISEQQRLR
jgi:hypothetical protein